MGMTVADFIKLSRNSQFLSSEDLLDKPAIVWTKIVRCGSGKVSDAGTSKKDEKALFYFEGLSKPYASNASNTQLISTNYGLENTDQWIGCAVGLFVNPHVRYAGRVVGGIRFVLPSGNYAGDMSPQKAAQLRGIKGKLPAPPKPKPKAKPADLSLVSVQFDWPGREEWGGKPLVELPHETLLDYRTRLHERACLTESKSGRRKLDAAVAAIDPVLKATAPPVVDAAPDDEQSGDDSQREPGQEG